MPEGLLSRGGGAAQPQEPTGQAPDESIQKGEPATPEEQKAYEVALEAISEIVHVNDGGNDSIMRMLGSGEPANALVEVSAMVLAEVDDKLNLPETVILELVADVLDFVIELGTNAGYFNLEDKEIQQIYVVLLKRVMDEYGFDEQDVSGLIEGMGEQELNRAADMVMEVA